MNIKELMENCENAPVSVVVSIADLKEFARELIAEARELGKAEKQPEEYLTPQEVADLLGVTTNTLWRWNKSGYLTHVKLGRKPYYKKSDIVKIKEG